MSTDAKDLHGVFQRLGSPAEVATSAAHEYRHARFARRHPVVMFVLLPVLSLPLLWFGLVMLVVLTCKMLGVESGKVSSSSPMWQFADAALPYVIVATVILPLALAATFFCRLANRAGVNWKWSLAACSCLAVFGSAAMIQLALPTETSRGAFMFGLGVSTHPSASQMLQFLLPLSIGGWTVWRQVRRQSAHLHHA